MLKYQITVWNREALDWDYKGTEAFPIDGKSFADEDKAKEFARECAKKYDQEKYQIDISKYSYHNPDEPGRAPYLENDGVYLGKVDFMESEDEGEGRDKKL